MVMFCGYCGNKVNLSQHRFCTSCGKSLENQETSVLENQDAEEKGLASPDSAAPEITSSVDEVSVPKEEPEEEHLSLYELPPSEFFDDTCESIPSDIESESELIYNVFEELDAIQSGSPIEQDIAESKYLCVYWTDDKKFPWKALTLDNKFMLGHYGLEEDAASAIAEYHKIDRGSLKVASKWEGKREEFRLSLIRRMYGPESDNKSSGANLPDDPEKRPPSIWAPITLVICAYIGGLLHHFNWEVARAIFMITNAPSVSIDAIGNVFPILLGLIHLAISQFFKSKRNSYSRRYIIIYWSIAAFVALLLASIGRG
jgi:hypothetical protein